MDNILKKELSEILIKNNIINRYSIDPTHRGGAEGYLRGTGHSHPLDSDNLLEDLSYYIMNKVPYMGTTRVYENRYKLSTTKKKKK
tara:strand:- start:1139 stop:1396 length:258 start_codon:yes stop_codon:yes gene_type:complete